MTFPAVIARSRATKQSRPFECGPPAGGREVPPGPGACGSPRRCAPRDDERSNVAHDDVVPCHGEPRNRRSREGAKHPWRTAWQSTPFLPVIASPAGAWQSMSFRRRAVRSAPPGAGWIATGLAALAMTKRKAALAMTAVSAPGYTSPSLRARAAGVAIHAFRCRRKKQAAWYECA
jgi:hypothetical protein